MVLTPREASRNPSYHSTPIRGAVTAEPVFGDEVLCHRHTGKMPPSGLGPPFLVQALKPAGGHFNEREMAVVRGVRSRRGQKITDAKFQIAVHGQWKGLRGKGGASCSGQFRYPLFGDAVYEGALLAGRRHGSGKQVCHSGVYVGEFQDGEMWGFGRRDYCDGGSYEGEWQNGLKHGKGTLVCANGDQYEGDFKEGYMHGHGVFRMADGDVYTGEMHQDCMHGEGEYLFAAPSNGRYRGQFAGNRRHGKGALEFEEDGMTFRYAGAFRDDAMMGTGTLISSNGDKYNGEFLEGKFHGRGEYSWCDGSRYQGEFVRGLMHGEGIYVAGPTSLEIHSEGERYVGQWCNGVRHGKGLVELTNRVSGEMETVEGTWRGGVREGDFVRRTSWGRVVYEHCRLGRRTAFSIDQNISCPSHLAYESHDKA